MRLNGLKTLKKEERRNVVDSSRVSFPNGAQICRRGFNGVRPCQEEVSHQGLKDLRRHHLPRELGGEETRQPSRQILLIQNAASDQPYQNHIGVEARFLAHHLPEFGRVLFRCGSKQSVGVVRKWRLMLTLDRSLNVEASDRAISMRASIACGAPELCGGATHQFSSFVQNLIVQNADAIVCRVEAMRRPVGIQNDGA